jgi:tetratricopeptide (TPR) repeat protein
VEHYQRALTRLAPDQAAGRAVLNMKIGVAYTQVGDERGLSFLQLAERELDPVLQTDELANTLASRGRYYHFHAQHQKAIELYERARQLAEPFDQPGTLNFIYSYLSGAYQHLTQYRQSQEWARREIALGERKNFPLAAAVGYEFLAENAINQGHWSEALDYATRDREIGEKIGALDRAAWAEMCRANALYGRGELSSAFETGQAALALAERIGEGRVAVLLGSLLARIETDLGRPDTAQADGELWLKRSDDLGQIFMQCLGRHGLAYYHVQRGEWAEAVALYDQCVAFYGPTDNRVTPLLLGPYPALARMGLGHVDEAAKLIADYLALAREAEAPHYAGCALRAQGQVLAAQGLTTPAAAAFDEAITTLDRLGSRLELGRAFYHRGLMRRGLGEAEAAQHDSYRALELFEACGAVRDQQLILSSLRV